MYEQTINKDTDMVTFMKIASGVWVSQALNVVARLGIADLLVSGSKSVEYLAENTQTHEQSLYRVLCSVASVGIFALSDDKMVSLTPLAEFMCTNNPNSLRYIPISFGDEWHWRGFGDMLHTVKTGESALSKAYQVDSNWHYLSKNEEAGFAFNQAMLGVAQNYHNPCLELYDFSDVKKVVDVAGGEGQVLSNLLVKYPNLTGVLYEMPQTAQNAISLFKQYGLIDRFSAIGGDIFESVPSGGDIYILSYILIDWNDQNCMVALKNIHKAMGGKGKLLVIDSIMPNANNGYTNWINWVDLFQLTMGYGKVRTEKEYNDMFESCGFRWNRTIDAGTPTCIMELVPII